MCLRGSNKTCYGTNMTKRRGPAEGTQTSHETAGRREADTLVRSFENEPVRELLVAGGFRRFTPAQMFPERAA